MICSFSAFGLPPFGRFNSRHGLGRLCGWHVSTSRAEEKKPSPCNEDAMIVVDASGSMSATRSRHPELQARIDEVRTALSQCCRATKYRRVGLVTSDRALQPVQRQARIQANAGCRGPHHEYLNALVPAGKTPLTTGVEQAQKRSISAVSRRRRRGDRRRETCGRSLASLPSSSSHAQQLTVHVIAFATTASPGPGNP